MQIAVLGIDLGKNSCSVAGLDATGRIVLRRRMHRDSVIKLASRQTVAAQRRPKPGRGDQLTLTDLPPRSTVHDYFDLWSWDSMQPRLMFPGQMG